MIVKRIIEINFLNLYEDIHLKRLPVIKTLANEKFLVVAGAMAIFDVFALDGASDMQFQALLAGQQSSVACYIKENFNALSTGVIFFLERLTRALILHYNDRV